MTKWRTDVSSIELREDCSLSNPPLLIPFLVATLINQLTPKNAPDDFWPQESDLLSVLDVPLFHVAGNILHRRNLGFLVGVHRRIGDAFFTAC